MALLGCLLHELHHKLMRFAHHGRPVYADQLVSGAQAPVFVCSSVFHDVANVNLDRKKKKSFKKFFFFFYFYILFFSFPTLKKKKPEHQLISDVKEGTAMDLT